MFLPINLLIDKPIVIFGYGLVGMRKAKFLSKLGFPVITIDSKKKEADLQKEITKDNFVTYLEEKPPLVIVAFGADDHVSKEIALYCKNHGILVNVVDRPKISTVIFSSILNHSDLSISISTQGNCPFYAKQLRKELTPFVEKKSSWLQVLTILRRKASDPKNELKKIYEYPEFQLLLEKENFDEALYLGQQILSGVVK